MLLDYNKNKNLKISMTGKTDHWKKPIIMGIFKHKNKPDSIILNATYHTPHIVGYVLVAT